ncbi:hypothetical protein PG994_005749 [Apiospora phragmitis]|uniref:Uncharacterized protein n=1 Tax=Apiospora phragmitis TaxID=2905665 RepID=A0ABR1VD38_9PEZI
MPARASPPSSKYFALHLDFSYVGAEVIIVRSRAAFGSPFIAGVRYIAAKSVPWTRPAATCLYISETPRLFLSIYEVKLKPNDLQLQPITMNVCARGSQQELSMMKRTRNVLRVATKVVPSRSPIVLIGPRSTSLRSGLAGGLFGG